MRGVDRAHVARVQLENRKIDHFSHLQMIQSL